MNCPNCGSNDTKGRWAANHLDWRCILVLAACYAEPHTHWKCRRCGYHWVT